MPEHETDDGVRLHVEVAGPDHGVGVLLVHGFAGSVDVSWRSTGVLDRLVAAGRRVVVHYTGWLYDESAADKKGRKFDSSKDRNEPFEFSLGAGEVIRGWDEGVKGMKVGGTRVLTIPPDMGYGARGAGGVIPPNATLLFEVELLDVR